MKKITPLLLLLASLPSLANANLLTNGSFESDVQASGTWNIYKNLIGWTGQRLGGIELRNNNAGTASDGFNFVELDTTFNSSMFQTVDTVNGAIYDLSFDYSGRAGVNKLSNGIKAFWNGVELASFTASGLGKTDNNWFSLEFQVVGTGHDKLSFAATGISDSFGGSLDNVNLVTAVPEPENLMLLLAGLGLLAYVSRRRRAV